MMYIQYLILLQFFFNSYLSGENSSFTLGYANHAIRIKTIIVQ